MSLRGVLLDRVLVHVRPTAHARVRWNDAVRDGGAHATLMRAFVRPGDTAMDIGANWGLYTQGLAELVGPGGQVVAFEPGPDHARVAKVVAGQGNVRLIQAAVSGTAGTVRMSVPEAGDTTLGALTRIGDETPEGSRGFEVQTVRLDDVEVDRGRLSFIKCDVEGHEDAVLDGGERTFREHHPVLLIEIEHRHRERPVAEILDRLVSWGYDAYALTSTGLRPAAEFDLERDQLAHLVDGTLPVDVPAGYVNDFLFLPAGQAPPALGG